MARQQKEEQIRKLSAKKSPKAEPVKPSIETSEQESQIDQPSDTADDVDSEGENWREWDETKCEQKLENNPLSNFARFRLSEIWIDDDRNLDDARKLLSSISGFKESEVNEYLGDIEYSDQIRDYRLAYECYKRAI